MDPLAQSATEASSPFLVEATWRCGFAATIRVTSFGGPRCETPASRRWHAIYSTQVLENGWQPYDQPNVVAYMPMRYAALESIPIDATHTLLRERVAQAPTGPILPARHNGCHIYRCDSRSLPHILGEIVYGFGLRGRSLLRCVRELRRGAEAVDVRACVLDLVVA